MSDVEALFSRCRQLGVELFPIPDGKLQVQAPVPLPETLRQELKERNAEILALITKPFLTVTGELRIPFTANRKYHWWAGGQSLAETLQELNA